MKYVDSNEVGARAVPETLGYDPALPTRFLLFVWLLVAGALTVAPSSRRAGPGTRGLTLTIQSGPDLTRARPPAAGVRRGRARPVGRCRARSRTRAMGRLLAGAAGPRRRARSPQRRHRLGEPRRAGDPVPPPGARSRGVATRVDLSPGCHPLSVSYEAATPGSLRLVWSRPGESPRDLDPASLFASPPSPGQRARGRLAAVLGPFALAAWVLPPLVVWWRTSTPERRRAVLRASRCPRSSCSTRGLAVRGPGGSLRVGGAAVGARRGARGARPASGLAAMAAGAGGLQRRSLQLPGSSPRDGRGSTSRTCASRSSPPSPG